MSALFVMDRAVRTNDVDLFTYSLTPIIELFFALNHQNYARYLIKYQKDLQNIDNIPGLRQLLSNEGLAMRRTDKPFSRVPVDLTLESGTNSQRGRGFQIECFFCPNKQLFCSLQVDDHEVGESCCRK